MAGITFDLDQLTSTGNQRLLDFKTLQGEERKKLSPEEIERKRKEAEELGPFQNVVMDG